MATDRELSHETQWTAGGFDFNVHSSDMDDRDVQISLITRDLLVNVDLDVYQLMHLRDVLNESIEELFEVDESIQCPACGYTRDEAVIHGDHKICRKFPFFPGEEGSSEAV